MSDSISKPMSVQCEICNLEIEWIQIEHPFDKKMRWVPCACPCVVEKNRKFWDEQKLTEKRIRISRVMKLSSAMEDIKSMTFDTFSVRRGAQSSYEGIRSAIENFKDRGKLGLFIFGETGNGKSHLTAAGGNELIRLGHAVIFITEKDLFSRLQATKNFKNPETFHEIMSACLEADLLIWDDFMSSQKLSDEEKDWIFQIINGRERADKPIWATSNITTKEFESQEIAYKLDDKGRTWWRLMGNMDCIYNQATNYRKLKAMARASGMNVEDYEKSYGGF